MDETKKIIEMSEVIVIIVSSVFSLLMAALVYIWNTTNKSNERRFSALEEAVNKIVDSHVEQKEILAELKTLVKSHDRDVERLKDNER